LHGNSGDAARVYEEDRIAAAFDCRASLAMTGTGSFRRIEAPRNEERKGALMQKKCGYVYILFNKRNGTLYTGVTSDLIKRVYEHKSKMVDGFTKKYGVDKLGYYEIFGQIIDAIEREKQIKAGSRMDKLRLIEKENPGWVDLYDQILGLN